MLGLLQVSAAGSFGSILVVGGFANVVADRWLTAGLERFPFSCHAG